MNRKEEIARKIKESFMKKETRNEKDTLSNRGVGGEQRGGE